MKKVINIYKPIGLTPLQLVNKFKEKYPKYKNIKIAYAGRLDPMAKGILVLLVEPVTKKGNYYQNLKKEYEFSVLFGVETDTYDVLGLIKSSKLKVKSYNSKLKVRLENIIKSFEGKHNQTYPPYSSKAVRGKPLFWWARKGKLSEIKLPTKKIIIHSIKLLDIYSESSKKIQNEIIRNIKKVKGDFRQKEILDKWEEFFDKNHNVNFDIAKLKVSCSSGTYVRSIAHKLGKDLETSAIALNIKRVKVGNYKIEDSLRV